MEMEIKRFYFGHLVSRDHVMKGRCDLGGDYMTPVCRGEISTCPAGTDFTLKLYGKIKFHPDKVGQSST